MREYVCGACASYCGQGGEKWGEGLLYIMLSDVVQPTVGEHTCVSTKALVFCQGHRKRPLLFSSMSTRLVYIPERRRLPGHHHAALRHLDVPLWLCIPHRGLAAGPSDDPTHRGQPGPYRRVGLAPGLELDTLAALRPTLPCQHVLSVSMLNEMQAK